MSESPYLPAILKKQINTLRNKVSRFRKQKNAAYRERDQLVALVSKLYPSHLARHPDSDTEWEDEWRWIVCIHTPAGQATWHIHDSEKELFNHLEVKEGHWDGHTTEEKYERLSQIGQVSVVREENQ